MIIDVAFRRLVYAPLVSIRAPNKMIIHFVSERMVYAHIVPIRAPNIIIIIIDVVSGRIVCPHIIRSGRLT